MNLDRYKETLFGKIETSKICNRRQELIKEIVDNINKEREGTKFKKVKPSFVAVKCSHLKESDLEYFISECRDYKNRKGSFGKCFFGALKTKI
jgi:hypothetical protein